MTSFVDSIRPNQKSHAIIFEGLSVIGGSLLLALLVQLVIPLPFSPVPLSLGTLGIFLLSALLGSKKGTYAVATYIVEGALGLPVFAKGGAGMAHLLGPTGGYLLGYVVAVFVVGYLLERGWKSSYLLTVLAMCVGEILILACGACWLFLFTGKETLNLGVYPFLAGDALKIIAAGTLISSGWQLMEWGGMKKSSS